MKLHEALQLKSEDDSIKIKRIGAVGEAKIIDLNSEKAWDEGWCVVTTNGKHINSLPEMEHFNMSIMEGIPGVCSSYFKGKCTAIPEKYCDYCTSEYGNGHC